MRSLFLAVLLLGGLSTAVPTGGSSGGTCNKTNVNANFDDLTPLTPVNLTPVPTGYKNLFFQAFAFTKVILDNQPNPKIVEHSPPNDGYITSMTQTWFGTPMITVNYPNSKTKSFDLQSFYFGCQIQALPSSCFVTVTGYVGNDNQVSAANQTCSQQFQYNPSTMTGPQQMAFSGPLKSCFTDVQFAIIQVTLEGGLSLLDAGNQLYFDDIKLAVTTCS